MTDLLTLYLEHPVTMGTLTLVAALIVTVAIRMVLK